MTAPDQGADGIKLGGVGRGTSQEPHDAGSTTRGDRKNMVEQLRSMAGETYEENGHAYRRSSVSGSHEGRPVHEWLEEAADELEKLGSENFRRALRLAHIYGLRVVFDRRLRKAAPGEDDHLDSDEILARLLETTKEDYRAAAEEARRGG